MASINDNKYKEYDDIKIDYYYPYTWEKRNKDYLKEVEYREETSVIEVSDEEVNYINDNDI